MKWSRKMSSNESPAWYALYTMPQCEKKVARLLLRYRIEFYLPLVRKQRKWSDRIKLVDFPLFPGYVFVYIPFYKKRYDVLNLPGALKFVEIEGRPASVQDEAMDSLRMIVSAAQDVQAHPEKNFPVGQKVIVRSGALKGVRGEILKIKNQVRLFVKLEECGLYASAEVDVADVEKLD